MTQISPKLIDIEGNRIPFVDGDEKTMDYSNRKVLMGGWGNCFGKNDEKFKIPFKNMFLENNGRFPTQLFTNNKNELYKYVKNIS